MFFYVSLVLVIVAAVTLVIGLLSSGLPLVIVSIGASFLAGVFLILTVVRERPGAAAGDAQPAALPPAGAPPAPTPSAAGGVFPIADYDDLKVSEILPLLPELDDEELEEVRSHEESAKARATVLNRIDELLSGPEPEAAADEWDEEFPIADYDDLTVGEITPLLPELDDDELDVVREREAATKARGGIIKRIDELLGVTPAKKSPAKKSAAKKKAPGKKTAAAKKSAAKKKAPAKKAGAAFPIANYDSLSAADVAKRLARLDEAQLKAVRTYEKRKQSRKTVLDRIEKELASR